MSLHLQNLEIRVGGFSIRAEELKVLPGEVVCLLGKSGSGKSTLLNAIAGFLPLAQGRVFIGEKDISLFPPERRHLGFVFQRPALFSHLTVSENIAFAARLKGIRSQERDVIASKWLSRVHLEGLGARFPHEISEGQAQRVSLARAMAAGFPVLLLDEPFSALDDETRKSLRELVVQLIKEEKVAALLVTHQPEDALALGARTCRIDKGRLLCET